MLKWLGRRVKSWFKHKDPSQKTTSQSTSTVDQPFLDFGRKSLDVANKNLNNPWANKYRNTADAQFGRANEALEGVRDFDINTADPYRDLFRKHAGFGADRIDRTLANTMADYDDASGFGRGGGGTAALKLMAGEQAARQKAELFSQADLDAIQSARTDHGLNMNNLFRQAAGFQGLGTANYGMGSQFSMHPLMMALQANQVANTAPQNRYNNTNTNQVTKEGGMPFMKFHKFMQDTGKSAMDWAAKAYGVPA